MPEGIRRRLERIGLTAAKARRECPTLGEWLAEYIAGRRDVKPNTRANYERTQASLIGFFGESKRLDEITAGDAEDFRVFLKTRAKKCRGGERTGLGKATLNRRCKRAKQFFAAAVKKRIIDENPFADMKCGNFANEQRRYHVSTEEAEAVLDACPDAQWCAIFALCRYGGLRCPSEVLALTWGDMDWEKQRFTVRASKTEHCEDGGVRVVPIFPELYPHLRDCFEEAEPGTEHVVARYRDTRSNLRTHLRRIIARAGLAPWPKLFQNLRSTRETDLMERFPAHVVCKWIGNSQPVAAKHYLQVTEDHYARAVQEAVHDPVQQASAQGRTESRGERAEVEAANVYGPAQNNAAPCEGGEPHLVGDTGLEPVTLRV